MKQILMKGTLALIFSLILWALPAAAEQYEIRADSCCNEPGDANNNGAVGILDVTYINGYVYMGGAVPPCMPEADPNGNGAINLLDVSYLINHMYRGGPAPICGPDPWPEG